MSDVYRYVVFQPQKQPTAEEVAALKACCETGKFRFAIGVNGADGGLALAFDAREFDAARATSGQFARLQRWQVRGSAVENRLLFITRPTALQPTPVAFLHKPAELTGEKYIKRKRTAAQEALGQASLKLNRTLQRHAWVQRVAKVVPYLLMGLGALATIGAGIYAGQRLLDSQGERRRQTIQRVADDAMEEGLSRQTVEDESLGHEEHRDD
ncbi:MAG: hypothetical protein AAGD11_18250 [Planctomycetota bacterium]